MTNVGELFHIFGCSIEACRITVETRISQIMIASGSLAGRDEQVLDDASARRSSLAHLQVSATESELSFMQHGSQQAFWNGC